MFCCCGPNLVILAWTRDKLWRRQASGYRTHRRTDRQTQPTTIPEGQNWPRVKTYQHILSKFSGLVRNDTRPIKRNISFNCGVGSVYCVVEKFKPWRRSAITECFLLGAGFCRIRNIFRRTCWMLFGKQNWQTHYWGNSLYSWHMRAQIFKPE